jgi:TolB protein
VTPDGRWVVYDAASVGVTRLFKVPVDGGTPEELTTATSHYPAVSPDGKAIAFKYFPGGTSPTTLSIVGIEGGTPRQNFRVPADAWRWEPGGRALIYVDNARSCLMRLPLATGTPTPMGTFSGGRIRVFDLSPDGKRVVFVRVTSKREVVKIAGFR